MASSAPLFTAAVVSGIINVSVVYGIRFNRVYITAFVGLW